MTAVTPEQCEPAPDRLLSVEEAARRIEALLKPVEGTERVFIRRALGRVLVQDLQSRINVPPYPNAAMDGYAVNSSDLPAEGRSELRLIGTAFAGRPFEGDLKPGECVRIMTGAVLPEGADTVIMQEHVQRSDGTVHIPTGYVRGQHVRHPGEDVAIGQNVLLAGRRIAPADLGLIASLGIVEVSVRRRPRVAFFSTGDELRGIGETLAAGQIYDSNRYSLHGMLTRLGVDLFDMGVVPDQPERIEAAFREGASIADVLITSGGVSVGEADFVKDALARLGKVEFWKIAMKPGKPLAYGTVGGALFFGLPGNPVSVMATFYQLVQPALRRLMGETDLQPLRLKATCVSALKKVAGRMEFQRGLLETDTAGGLVVHTTGLQDSHVLSSMSRANCFIVLPAQWGDVPAEAWSTCSLCAGRRAPWCDVGKGTRSASNGLEPFSHEKPGGPN